MTVITPLTRPHLLSAILNTLDFRFIDEWLIVIDCDTPAFNQDVYRNHPCIKILQCPIRSRLGSCKRNVAMDAIQNKQTFLYFLDDDNIIHPDVYEVLGKISPDESKFYTFDQILRSKQLRLRGNRIERFHIDAAMYLVPFGLCQNIRWNTYLDEGDGIFIEDVFAKHPGNHVYMKNRYCYYNYLA